jgi:hypothetical protein
MVARKYYYYAAALLVAGIHGRALPEFPGVSEPENPENLPGFDPPGWSEPVPPPSIPKFPGSGPGSGWVDWPGSGASEFPGEPGEPEPSYSGWPCKPPPVSITTTTQSSPEYAFSQISISLPYCLLLLCFNLSSPCCAQSLKYYVSGGF